MKRSAWLTTISVSLCLLSSTLWAGKPSTFESVLGDSKLDKSIQFHKGGKPSKKGEGVVPYLAKLDAPPRRVALISFYVFDPGKSTGTYYASVRTFNWLTQDGASHFAQRFHEQGIDSLRQAFAAHGMTLLTPDEFLDTDAKRQAYTAYEIKRSAAAKIAMGLVKRMTRAAGGDTEQSAVAAGYRLLATHNVPTDPKTAVSLNDLRLTLDVDALVVVKNGTFFDGKNLTLGDIQLMMYGPNPMQKIEGKRYIQWKDGHHYTSATLTLRPRPGVAVFKKDKIVEETYDGYEKLLALLADRVGADLVRKIEAE